MSKQDFALDAAATQRITIDWTAETEPATVLLNGTVLGMLITVEEKLAGKDFILPDNSPLHVQFFNGNPQVYRAGVPLAPVAGVPDKQRKRGGCLTTWLILNLIANSAATVLYFLAMFGAMVNHNVRTPALAFLLLAITAIAAIVGTSLLLAWKKVGFYLEVGAIVCNIAIAIIFGLMSSTIFSPLVWLGVLYFWLKRSGVWENLA